MISCYHPEGGNRIVFSTYIKWTTNKGDVKSIFFLKPNFV